MLGLHVRHRAPKGGACAQAHLIQLTSSPRAAAAQQLPPPPPPLTPQQPHDGAPGRLRRTSSGAVPPPSPGQAGTPGSPLNMRPGSGLPGALGPDLLRTLSPSSEAMAPPPARTLSLGAVGTPA